MILGNFQKYFFKRYCLTLRPESYLVEVKALNDRPRRCNKLRDLPDWIFQSRLAIWLTDEDGPIQERSVRGDQIRKLFYLQFAKESIA